MNRGFDAVKYWTEFTDYNAKPAPNGLLFNIEYCTDCHSCELACQMHLKLPPEQWGIKVLEYGPTKNVNGDWEWTYLPMPTDLCDGCKDRVAEGRLPMCVHHCQTGIILYGPVEELAEKAKEKPKMVLFTLDQD